MSLPPGRPSHRTLGGLPAAALSYALAIGATLVALCVRWALDPWLGDLLPLVTLYGAVAASVWFGGWRPALVSVLLGGILANYWFVAPRGAFELTTPVVIGFVAYLVTCAIIVYFGERLRRTVHDAAQQRDMLRITLASIGDAVITTDFHGRVTSMNAVAESLTGWSQSDANGRALPTVLQVLDARSGEPAESPAARALRQGAGVAGENTLVARDGSQRKIEESAAPIRNQAGRVVGAVLVFRDVTERRDAERRRAERFDAARVLAAIVTSSQDAIISKSLEGIIQSWNAGAERIFGYTAAEAIGRHISLILPPDRVHEEDEIIRRMRAGELVDHFHTVRRRKDGSTISVSLTISPVRDERGQIIGASKIARDITEQKKAERRLEELMAELRNADRAKNEFLATLAHELRGPLAPVRNSLEILKHGVTSPGLIAPALATLERQVSQMERLIEDLLDIERIARNRVALRVERVSLGAVLQRAVEACRPAAEAAKHDVTVTLPPEPIHVDGDAARLVQVFSNLLNNAYKYTDPGGRVEVTVTREDGEALVSVSDNGIGIPPELLPRIFDIFAQVEQRSERTQGGLGLGLNLVKQLVALHGGQVDAFSNGSGHGSEFVVRLPIAVGERAFAQGFGAEQNHEAVRPTGRRILIADDLRDSADSLAMLLRLAGHDVHVAYDGMEALEAAQRLQPDLVLLDLGMPKLSGLDACRKARAQPWGQDLRIVALTSWARDDDRRRSREAGFDAHLVKPADIEDIEMLLREPAE